MSEPRIPTLADPLDHEQIAAYLRENPDFFVSHQDLLADLRLPHESGPAVSLVERQVSVLRERNMDMRHRLSKLLDNARDNDKLFDKTRRLILNLLEGQDLADIIDALYYSFDHDFGIHYTRVLLFGNIDRIPGSHARVVALSEARHHISSLLKNNRATCGAASTKEIAFIFGEQAPDVGSVAIVPLVHGAAFGLLAIGNRDPDYYRSSMGTLFLGYIAEVLNRLLPKHLPR